MTMLLEFLERHRARHLFRSSHLNSRFYGFSLIHLTFSDRAFFGLVGPGGGGSRFPPPPLKRQLVRPRKFPLRSADLADDVI